MRGFSVLQKVGLFLAYLSYKILGRGRKEERIGRDINQSKRNISIYSGWIIKKQ